MPECNATYKNGISFRDWSSVPGYEEYFHPFGCTIDALTYKLFVTNTIHRRQGFDVDAHPNKFFLMANLAQQKLAPIAPANFPFQFDYGYHFDSELVGKFLKKKAVESGVKHVEGTVEHVDLHDNGDISNITLKDGQQLSAGLFVDCTGFRSLLLQQTLKVPFKSFAENLFNDSAVAMPTMLTPDIPAETVSTALTNGWAWEIPLTNRFGNGYVYSSSFISADEAETELRTKLGMLDSDVEARHLKMKVGRVAESWHKNCVAIGLSQGFIEPLEATALQFIHTTIEEFMQAYEIGGFTNQHQATFNQRINNNFEGIRDYIVLHYKTNSRTDTEYWRANRENTNISANLQEMLHTWDNLKSVDEAVKRLEIGKYYTPTSWNALLAGVGRFPAVKKESAPQHLKEVDIGFVTNFLQGCSLNFDAHGDVLSKG